MGFRLLGTVAALVLFAQGAVAQSVLRVGDQIAGNRSVMEAAGVLQGVPYRIEWAQFTAAAPLLEALNAGALDVGFTGDVPFLFVYAAGAPVRVIGAVVSGAGSNAIVVPKGSPAQSLRDLVGKRLAVNKGGNGHYLALSALQHAGIDPKSVTLVMLAPPDARLALNGGSVDAWAVWDPYISLAVMEDGGRVLVDGTDAYVSDTFDLARVDAIAAKADMIADFERRLVQARRWALTHVKENAAQVSLQTHMPVAVVERSLQNRMITPIPVDDAAIAHTQAEADLFEKYHVLPQHIDMTGAFDRRFSGPSLAR
jgi:sulfonate transport system substrate-binding protein